MPEVENCHRVRIFAAAMWCPSSEEWEIKGVYLSCKQAIARCEKEMRDAVRANSQLQHWRVERYHLTPAGGKVMWGAADVMQADNLEAPDCVG